MSQLTPSIDSIRKLHFETVEDVLHRSLKQLFIKNKILPSNLDRRPYANTLDGGIEICFSIPEDEPIPPLFKVRNVIIQSKAVSKRLSPLAFKNEVDKEDVEHFFHCFDEIQYIIAYSKLKFPKGKASKDFKQHLKELNAELKKLYPDLYKKIKLEIWLTDDIKTLVDLSPSSWELFPDRHLLALRANTLEFIEKAKSASGQLGFTGAFVANASRLQKIEQISKTLLEDSNKVIEIRGNMGIGKTRLCYEVIRKLNLKDVCIWLEAPNSFLLNQLDTYLYSNEENSIVLFNDELRGEDLQQIKLLKSKYPSQLKALVILPYRSEEPGNSEDTTIVLEKMPNDELHSIISAYGFTPDLINKICQICKGYPKLAVAIAEKLTKEASSITTDQAITLLSGEFYDSGNSQAGWFRLIMDETDRKNLGVMSVLNELGHKNTPLEELKLISDYFSIPLNELRKTINRSIKKGLLVDIGDYFYITPLILANQLASMTFKEHQDSLSNLIEKIESLQHRQGRRSRTPLESFKDRLVSCSDDEEIKAIAASVITGFDENFLKAAFQNESLLEFVLGLGHIFPQVILNLIERTLRNSNSEKFLQIEKRQALVWYLEKAAFYDDLFVQAMNCLFILATHETDTWANNSTGVFIGFFAPYLSGSSVSFESRVSYLKHISSQYDDGQIEQELIEKCIECTLSSNRSRSTGHENAFKIPKQLKETEQQVDYLKVSEVQLSIINFFKESRNNKLKHSFYEILASRIRIILKPMIKNSFWETIQLLIDYNDSRVSKRLFGSIASIIKFDHERYTPEDVEKLKDIAKSLQEKDFATQLAVVANNNHVMFGDEEWIKLMNKSCKDLVQNPGNFIEVIKLQKGDTESNLHSYLYTLGKTDSDLILWEQLKLHVVSSEVFSNYITGFANNNDQEKGIQLVNELSKLGASPKLIIMILSSIQGKAAKKAVLDYLEIHGAELLVHLRHTVFTRELNSEDINLMVKLSPESSDLLIPVIANQITNLDLDQIDLSPIIKSICNNDKTGMDKWYVEEKFLPQAFSEDKYLSALLELFEKGIQITINSKSEYNFSHSQYASEVIELIANKYPDETFPLFHSAFLNSPGKSAFASVHFKGWPVSLYQKQFIKIFKNENFETCYAFSRFLPNERGLFTESAAILIKRFEKHTDLEGRFHSLLFSTYEPVWGGMATHYKKLITKLEIWSEANGLQKKPNYQRSPG